MIASGAGWPAGSPGSGAGGTTGAIGRNGDRAGPGGDAVRPVTGADAPADRPGGRADERARRGRAGSARDQYDGRSDQAAAQQARAGGSRALVPVARPQNLPLVASSAAEESASYGRVPVTSAPRLSVPMAAYTTLAVQATGVGGGDGASARTAPGPAAAASDSYRRQGAQPTLPPQGGRVFRLSI